MMPRQYAQVPASASGRDGSAMAGAGRTADPRDKYAHLPFAKLPTTEEILGSIRGSKGTPFAPQRGENRGSDRHGTSVNGRNSFAAFDAADRNLSTASRRPAHRPSHPYLDRSTIEFRGSQVNSYSDAQNGHGQQTNDPRQQDVKSPWWRKEYRSPTGHKMREHIRRPNDLGRSPKIINYDVEQMILPPEFQDFQNKVPWLKNKKLGIDAKGRRYMSRKREGHKPRRSNNPQRPQPEAEPDHGG
ncbi:uncharacterized protein KY384_003548 [Bacidia gigantensis]|uniref:uncharacterized protein n=1 Tax=Bacidia gigantensis TaxID=2732470 RepID=UPI001D047778|nr:uncharacterized protein KY384_003548 [Bacidia gigantensis]KAG8531912.1 hypothetical protein KY384_003548 [Bacidia gigantensis]